MKEGITRAISVMQTVGPSERMFADISTIPHLHRIKLFHRGPALCGYLGYVYYPHSDSASCDRSQTCPPSCFY